MKKKTFCQIVTSLAADLLKTFMYLLSLMLLTLCLYIYFAFKKRNIIFGQFKIALISMKVSSHKISEFFLKAEKKNEKYFLKSDFHLRKKITLFA